MEIPQILMLFIREIFRIWYEFATAATKMNVTEIIPVVVNKYRNTSLSAVSYVNIRAFPSS